MWSGGGAVPEPQSGAAREAEAGRCHQWWEKQLEQEGDAELGWGLLGDAYDRCGEVYAEYAAFYLGEPITPRPSITTL